MEFVLPTLCCEALSKRNQRGSMTRGLDTVVVLGGAESSSTRRPVGSGRRCCFLWRSHVKLRRFVLEGSMTHTKGSTRAPCCWDQRVRTVTGLAQMRRSCS